MTKPPGSNCGNCRFGIYAQGPDGKINFRARVCKWGPPVVLIIPTKDGLTQNCMWPTLAIENYCFRHEPNSVVDILAADQTEQPEQTH